MTKVATTYENVINDIRASQSQKIKLAVTDLDGVLRGKYIHKEKFLKAAKSGLGFCNVVFGWDCNDVCYDNTDYTGWHTGYPDAEVRLDFATYRKVPWDNNVPFFLGEFRNEESKPLEVCPRQLLRRVIDNVNSAGFSAEVGLEFEWFNFRETPDSLNQKKFKDLQTLSPGMFGYSISRPSLNRPYFSDIMDKLLEFDVPLEGFHTETGPGVFEAAILHSNALEAADRAVLFKASVKEIAYPYGIIACFMAKWSSKLPGCSGHIHQSLINAEGENVFYSAHDSTKMSQEFRYYLAGQMHCIPELLVMFAPTVNSYKRLVEGFWAPTRVTWGKDNRTAAYRVIVGSKGSTRLETRVGGSDLNPYLGVAAAIASGFYGIENKIALKTDPITGNAYRADNATRLPRNLMEATDKFHKSELARAFFGNEFVEHFAKTREWEWRQFQEAVTDWELQRYFEII